MCLGFLSVCVRVCSSVCVAGWAAQKCGQGLGAGTADTSVGLVHVAHPAQFLVVEIAERFQIFVYTYDLGYWTLLPLLWCDG